MTPNFRADLFKREQHRGSSPPGTTRQGARFFARQLFSVSTMILQLDPPLPMTTPRGTGLAHFLIDYGPETHLYWTVFLDDTGECWTFQNPEVRVSPNPSLGRTSISKFRTPAPIPGHASIASENIDQSGLANGRHRQTNGHHAGSINGKSDASDS
jgi:hypothetical protein